MIQNKFLFALLLLLTLIPLHLWAADISCIQNRALPCQKIYIHGQIVSGDYDKFTNLMQNHYVAEVVLISLGGDVGESIKIGHLIRQKLLSTTTSRQLTDGRIALFSPYPSEMKLECQDSSCVCASACFLIWAAGIDRYGDGLIVHRPKDTSGTFGSKTPEQAKMIYDGYLKDMKTYLEEMEVPPKYIQMMIDTPSNDGRMLNPKDVESDLEGYPLSIHEWLLADCSMLTKAENDEWLDLMLRKNTDNLSEQDDLRYKDLSARSNKSYDCTTPKIRQERQRLQNQ